MDAKIVGNELMTGNIQAAEAKKKVGGLALVITGKAKRIRDEGQNAFPLPSKH